ncbi:unnamed protein product [Acanthoscelides obtectus]|uniref:Uncharacterized protein n=1 Tax=Acanthoscelides obtectus TaxID=200917 RepID=A0A9P0KB47_ACAOB|nr:unnamed protein product [Acanthoscelides obtectus]CAK1677908.1 hypothetical protein AOBTE_LOCUS31639 [Acanthoscelides obtectus]
MFRLFKKYVYTREVRDGRAKPTVNRRRIYQCCWLVCRGIRLNRQL